MITIKRKPILLLLSTLMSIYSYGQLPAGEDRFQLFIDFLDQEKRYKDDIIYYPFPFEDVEHSDNRGDQFQSTESHRIWDYLYEGFTYNREDSIKPKYQGRLKLPHRIKAQTLSNNTLSAKARITMPDSIVTLNFGAADIGVTRSFDQLEITLMHVNGNTAYLLVEDKSKLNDYSYTQPGYVFSDKEEKDTPEKPYFELEPFNKSESIIKSHTHISDVTGVVFNDGWEHFSVSRITGIVRGAKGVTLGFESLGRDFRHYLWYRNMDMPYDSMKDIYQQQQQRFASPKGNNQYHPIHVVLLQASGIINEIDIRVCSNSAHPLDIDLGERSFAPETSDKPNLEKMMQQIASISEETEETLPQRVKVASYALHPRSREMSIVAFLPFNYNAQNWRGDYPLKFNQLTITAADGETTTLEDFEQGPPKEEYFFWDKYGCSLSLVSIPMPTQDNTTLAGEIAYDYPNYRGARYDLPELPEGYRCENDTLFIKNEVHSYGDELTAYDEEGKDVPYQMVYSENEYGLIFARLVKSIVIITHVNTIRGKMPFSLPLLPPGQ